MEHSVAVTNSSFLRGALGRVPLEATVVNLGNSRLDQRCLLDLLDWMEQRPNVRVHLGACGIGFPQLAEALIKKLGNLDWLMSGRVGTYPEDSYRELDCVHALGFQEGRQISMSEAFQQLNQNLAAASQANKETAQGLARLEKIVEKSEAGTQRVRQWFVCASYEVLIAARQDVPGTGAQPET